VLKLLRMLRLHMLMLMDAAGVHSATDQNERGKTAGAKYIHEDDHGASWVPTGIHWRRSLRMAENQ